MQVCIRNWDTWSLIESQISGFRAHRSSKSWQNMQAQYIGKWYVCISHCERAYVRSGTFETDFSSDRNLQNKAYCKISDRYDHPQIELNIPNSPLTLIRYMCPYFGQEVYFAPLMKSSYQCIRWEYSQVPPLLTMFCSSYSTFASQFSRDLNSHGLPSYCSLSGPIIRGTTDSTYQHGLLLINALVSDQNCELYQCMHIPLMLGLYRCQINH